MTDHAQPPQLAWESAPRRELLRLAGPMALGGLSYQLKTVLDTLFVGWLGPSQLAGVGLGATLAVFLLCFPIGQLDSLRVLISQARGAGDEGRALGYVRAGVALALLLGILFALLGAAALPLIPLLGGSAVAGQTAQSYLGILLLGAPLVLVHTGLKDGREGWGDARSPMLAALLGNVVNVVLNYLFIFQFSWGASGAAWASVVAAGIELLFIGAVQRKHGLGGRDIAKRDVIAVWRLGVPMGAQYALGVGAFAIMTVLIARMSDEQMAAHQIALHLTHLAFLPTMALAGALSVMAGQAVGASRSQLVPKLARLALVLQLAYVAVIACLFGLGAPSLAGMFSEDAATLATATGLLRVSIALQLLDGASSIARAALRGSGDVRYPALVGIIAGWLCTPPMTWLLGHVAGLGARGGWLGLCLEMFVAGALLWRRLQRRDWSAVAKLHKDGHEDEIG